MITLPFTTRGRRNRGRLGAVDRVDVPQLSARCGVERDQPAVEQPTKTLPCHTATPRLTTSQQALTAHSPGTAGSKAHSGLPVAAIRFHLAPRSGHVQDAVHDQRRCYRATTVEIREPRQRQLPDRRCVDLIERAEPLLTVRSPVRHPLARLPSAAVGERRLLRRGRRGHFFRCGRTAAIAARAVNTTTSGKKRWNISVSLRCAVIFTRILIPAGSRRGSMNAVMNHHSRRWSGRHGVCHRASLLVAQRDQAPPRSVRPSSKARASSQVMAVRPSRIPYSR